MKKKDYVLQVRVTDEMLETIEHKASEMGVSKSDIVRMVLFGAIPNLSLKP